MPVVRPAPSALLFAVLALLLAMGAAPVHASDAEPASITSIGSTTAATTIEAPAETAAESVVAPSAAASLVQNAETGIASWYGNTFHRKRTASGETFDAKALTAAHPTLPFGTWVQVTLLSTGRSVVVRITDRGPHIANRLIDISRAAAAKIGLVQRGADTVRIEPVAAPPAIR